MGKYGHAGDGTNHGQYGVPLEDEEAALAAWHADQDAAKAGPWEVFPAEDPQRYLRTDNYEHEPTHGVTALMLTQQEWDDLEAMVRDYRAGTEWFEALPLPPYGRGRIVQRRRALAERIIEANQP